MRGVVRLALALGLVALLSPIRAQAQALTVEEMISLIKARVSEEVILMKVKEVPGGLDLTSEDMVKLREAGASDKFLMEVLKAAGDTAVSPDEPVHVTAAPQSATLMVSTEPSGARVMVDGVPVGVTPYVSNQLEPGQHEVYISKRFYRSTSRTLSAKIGDKLELTERLPLELPGVAVALKTKGLPKGNRYAVRGAPSCEGGGFLAVERDEGKEEGRVVLRSHGERLSGSTCLEVYFWMEAKKAGPGGIAPDPDVVFRIEGVDLDAVKLTELDLLVEHDEESPTGVRCRIVAGPGRVMRDSGGQS
jgi:PEGA domain-containing protein